MTTLLQEILNEEIPAGDKGHKTTCSCGKCCLAKTKTGTGYKHWRQRRKERYPKPVPRTEAPVRTEGEAEQFLDPALGTAIRIGQALTNDR